MACMLKTLPHTPLINTHKQTADSCHAGCWSDHRGGVSQGSVCCSTSVSAQNITNQNLILFTVLCFRPTQPADEKQNQASLYVIMIDLLSKHTEIHCLWLFLKL